jgi:uncharacterized protein (DUF433 family)
MTPTADLLDRITINPDQCGGRPCIRGMRIRVSDVLTLLATGQSQEEVLETYPYLEADDVTACLQYATREEAELDHSQITQRLSWTPKQRLDHLVEMVAIKELGHRAQQVDESHRADNPAGVKAEHDED